MYTLSPLIKDRQLSLTSTGDLMMAPDIQTQMIVSLCAYHCIYDYDINSALIPYLQKIPVGGINTNDIQTIVTSAYQSLIQQQIITNLGIAPILVTNNIISINITANDSIGQPIVLKWDNTQI